jgi:putative membrane protein
MLAALSPLLLHWAVTTASLWAASRIFHGVRFAGLPSLLVAGLLLGVVNSVVRPLLIVITLPITIVTLGLFLLVINALMLLLVAALVRGFTLSGFWTAFFAGAFIALLSFAADSWLASDAVAPIQAPVPAGNGRTIEARDAARPPAWAASTTYSTLARQTA